jgi:hypothetical protein
VQWQRRQSAHTRTHAHTHTRTRTEFHVAETPKGKVLDARKIAFIKRLLSVDVEASQVRAREREGEETRVWHGKRGQGQSRA